MDDNEKHTKELMAKIELLAWHQRMNDGMAGYATGIVVVTLNALVISLFGNSMFTVICFVIIGFIAGWVLRKYIYSHTIFPREDEDEPEIEIDKEKE